MEKFATLEPVRLYNNTVSNRFSLTRNTLLTKPSTHALIGRLPADLHVLILTHLPIPDFSAYARASHATAAIADTESIWETRWKALHLHKDQELNEVLDQLEEKTKSETGEKIKQAPPTITVVTADDDFGEFTSSTGAAASAHAQVIGANALDPMDGFGSQDEMGDFVGVTSSSPNGPMTFSPFTPLAASLSQHLASNGSFGFHEPRKDTFKSKYIRAHRLLAPLTAALASPPHLVLSELVQAAIPRSVMRRSNSVSIKQQAQVLQLLSLFLAPRVQPLRTWTALYASLRAAMDRFDATLLAAFDVADGKGDEQSMREAALASWGVWKGQRDGVDKRHAGGGSIGFGSELEWEMGKVWGEKREVFYMQDRWNPLDNVTKDGGLDFDAMDAFMNEILGAIVEHGSRAVRVFPPASQVLILFAERIAIEVVGEYITTLLSRARELSTSVYLRATAASFREAWRMVDAILQAASQREDSQITRTKAEDVVYQMFEANMDEYLDEEVESLKQAFEGICKDWEKQASSFPSTFSSSNTQPGTRFLDPANPHAHNPAQVKRTVLASFTSVLLLPVTIVPRTAAAVGGALMTGGNAAVQGIAMLNPQRWVGGGVGGTGMVRTDSTGRVLQQQQGWAGNESLNLNLNNNNNNNRSSRPSAAGYEGAFGSEPDMVFDAARAGGHAPFGDELDDGDEAGWGSSSTGAGGAYGNGRESTLSTLAPSSSSMSGSSTLNSDAHRANRDSTATIATTNSNSNARPKDKESDGQLDTLLSLDVALELIHADREVLKRVETFAGYPGHYGFRVRDTIEEVFILMLQAMGERHVGRGFSAATERMNVYKPGEHEEFTSVAPLLQFFELVHIGDMIQSMVQVYFDKELAPHIDKTDFLNAVVREKKKFENMLDDSVAGGLNTGTQLLMNQVEHIVLTMTKPREYYPPEDTPLDLGPTKGCLEAIKCLEMHCKMLKGSTSKEVLEVFYQEVGIRLIAIIQKHIKRQIISLNGGFQVIADLNTYHTFVSSLKVPGIAADFSHLKMLGHVYVVEDAKDLAQIVRDVTRYGGAYRPEDIYEFIQRRSDWKKIEKVVDKTMYNLSFKEDCVIM